jgi:hypothetical protein
MMQIRKVKKVGKEKLSRVTRDKPKALTSRELAKLAGRAIKTPESITLEEIKQLAASVLSQRKPPRTTL